MVLISFLMLFWTQKVALTPWGHFNPPQMLRNTLWFLDIAGFCLNFALIFFEFWLFPGNQSYWVLLLITCVPVLQPWPFNIFFLFFAWSCVSIWLRWPPKIFSVKKIFDPQNGQQWSKFGQNSHFWVFFVYIQTPL